MPGGTPPAATSLARPGQAVARRSADNVLSLGTVLAVGNVLAMGKRTFADAKYHNLAANPCIALTVDTEENYGQELRGGLSRERDTGL